MNAWRKYTIFDCVQAYRTAIYLINIRWQKNFQTPAVEVLNVGRKFEIYLKNKRLVKNYMII